MKKLGLYVERYAPFLIAAAITFALYKYRGALAESAQSEDITIPILYTSVFDWAAIQTGFLFGIFGYVGGKSDGFIAEVKNTESMGYFLGYMRTAIWLGFVLTFASIPMMVTQHDIGSGDSWRFFIFLSWVFLSVWAFFAFLRVAYIFGLLLRPSAAKRIPG